MVSPEKKEELIDTKDLMKGTPPEFKRSQSEKKPSNPADSATH